MVGKTALNKEMKHLNGAYFRTINHSSWIFIAPLLIKNGKISANFLLFYQRITQVIFQVRFICPGRGKWLILDVGLQTGKITLIPIL